MPQRSLSSWLGWTRGAPGGPTTDVPIRGTVQPAAPHQLPCSHPSACSKTPPWFCFLCRSSVTNIRTRTQCSCERQYTCRICLGWKCMATAPGPSCSTSPSRSAAKLVTCSGCMLSKGGTQPRGEQRVGPRAPAVLVAHLPIQDMTDTSITFEFTQANLEGFHCSSRAQCYLRSCISLPGHFWGCLQTPALPTLIQGARQQGRDALPGKGNVPLSPRPQLAGRLEVEQCIRVTLPAFLPDAQEERRIPFAIRWEELE